jgi:hypothetical protein
MEPVSVELNLLRAVLTPDLTLDVGRTLMVRVASVEAGGRGILSLAGILLEAELPEGVSAGQELKLVVRELTPQRVVLGVQADQQQPQAAFTLLAALLPMPSGGSVKVEEHSGSRTKQLADGSHSVRLRYEAPHFGAIDMQFLLDPRGALRLAMLVPPGGSLEAAQAGTMTLRGALAEATGGAVSLSIAARRQPLDVFA